jgi:uncharacterized iron-regulated protein
MKLIFVLAFTILGFEALSQEGIEKHFKIYNSSTRQPATIEEMVAACSDANVVFFGEEHSDSAGHYLEAAIFKAMYKSYGSNLALSMEMFETDCQLVIDEYLSGLINEDRLIRDGRAWNNYKDYRPAVEFAKANKLAVVAANPPRRYVNLVTRRGMRSLDSLPQASKKFLPPLPYDTLEGRYREKFMDIMKGSPGASSPRIYYSQTLWDAGMANSIYQFWKKNKNKKIFHMVGRFHSDEKLGTAAQLQKRKKGIKIMNISCFSDASFSQPQWEKFTQLGDFIIITDPDLKKTF